MKSEEKKGNRQISIDAFRAVTLLLMIFVNDEGTLVGIPSWLGHADANADALGFADIIFPAFLFIVGLSIPLAITKRIERGDTTASIAKHILLRSLSLLIIGFYQVNLSNYSSSALLPKPWWGTLLIISIFLVWLDYPQNSKSFVVKLLRALGICLLLFLAFIYVGDVPGGHIWMEPKWWGILGLIGWTYLIAGILYLYSKGRLFYLVMAFLIFVFFNSATQLGWLDGLRDHSYVWLVGDGSMPALTTAGVIVSLLYQQYRGKVHFWVLSVVLILASISFGLLTRPLWGISKIRATPSWVTICLGISIAAFAFFVYLIEVKGHKKWYNTIKPAGTSTLTCYLMPSLHYALLGLIHASLPLVLRTGVVGLLKSLLYSLCIILIVGMMEKRRLRLRL